MVVVVADVLLGVLGPEGMEGEDRSAPPLALQLLPSLFPPSFHLLPCPPITVTQA